MGTEVAKEEKRVEKPSAVNRGTRVSKIHLLACAACWYFGESFSPHNAISLPTREIYDDAMRRGGGLAVADDWRATPAAHGAHCGGVEDRVAAAAGDGDVADMPVGGDSQAEVNRAV